MHNLATRRRLPRTVPVLLTVLAVALAAVFAPGALGSRQQADAAGGGPGNAAPQALPVGYDDYLVFVANGSWNAFEPDSMVPGCEEAPFFCDGQFFQEQIMGRSAAEIAAKEQEAVEHFEERFGIDVHDPANEGRVQLDTFMLDPRANYRVYSWGGQRVPPQGYEVRDGGWVLTITDPDGYTLGGDFEGVHVPVEAAAAFGDYSILVTDRAGTPRDEVVLSYRADVFIAPNEFGDMAFSCQLSDDELASGETTGFAQGFVGMLFDEDGTVDFNARNVLTFGPEAARRR